MNWSLCRAARGLGVPGTLLSPKSCRALEGMAGHPTLDRVVDLVCIKNLVLYTLVGLPVTRFEVIRTAASLHPTAERCDRPKRGRGALPNPGVPA